MTRAVRSATVGMVLVLVAGLAAQPRPLQSIPAVPTQAGSQWAKDSKLFSGVTQPTLGLSAQWRFQRSAEGDLLLDLEHSRGDCGRAGSLLLLAEGALLSRGLARQRGRELDAIRGPLLMLQPVGLGTSAPMAFADLDDVRRRAREWGDQNNRRARR